MKFRGKVLVIGYGAVSRCALPLIFKLMKVDPGKVTVMDFAPVTLDGIREHGVKFVGEKMMPLYPLGVYKDVEGGKTDVSGN